ncbi:hypothetical protein M231_01237 [Tremella mesenterica]|uniref:Probable RNA polymerase II nuclear localization protein SLC7A6OS n=1 Tax=Tremella mesenterica TaxID=5217 RepID=A0A4Q1BTW6_TREME|nr:uncharacterized protein TREMEDRAFT_64133 [Tremella mesenterica DSM 1558]EIW67544.1 hypothetical protein TREMEDRAFT_64133 [Tremella mesenterica DSM 1558]RXK41529.1 hypothetical protein M231_01237 [Tremella mesenterica]
MNQSIQPNHTIIRIKRKATDPPLSSLVIQDTSKRRRDVSGRPRGVFRLADTVPHTWRGEGEEQLELKQRIENLRSGPSFVPPLKSFSSSHTPPEVIPTTPTSPPNLPGDNGLSIQNPTTSSSGLIPSSDSSSSQSNPSSSRVLHNQQKHNDFGKAVQDEEAVPNINEKMNKPHNAGKTGEEIFPAPRSTLPVKGSSLSAARLAYRIIPPVHGREKRKQEIMVPKVYSAEEWERQQSSLLLIDAQAIDSHAREIDMNQIAEEKEMEAFLPMLEEYLKLDKNAVINPLEKEEYVYDLYYKDFDSRPLGVGDGVTPLSVGQLLGYEDLSPPSSDSESELEDEADEDSNDEGYYRNDYPEDEEQEGSSGSEGSEGSEGSNDQRSGGEGGLWDYR